MKWLFTLLFITSFFIVSSFYIAEKYALAYRWMTFGMAIVSFIFYFMIKNSKAKNIGGNLTAIVVKFILSSLVFVSYIAIFKSKNKIDYYFFITAYVVLSIVSYSGAYFSVKEEQANS